MSTQAPTPPTKQAIVAAINDITRALQELTEKEDIDTKGIDTKDIKVAAERLPFKHCPAICNGMGGSKTWDQKLQILLRKIPSVEHESTSGAFNFYLAEDLNNIRPMLTYKLTPLESTAVEGSNHIKEPMRVYVPGTDKQEAGNTL